MFTRIIISLVFLLLSVNTDAQDTIIDRDGNSYPIIKIGNQYWMTKNLVTAHYPGGNVIHSICYDNDRAYCEKYGRLYLWKSLVGGLESDSLLNVCPDGWHVPSIDEWKTLFDTLGGLSSAGATLRRSKKSNFNFQWGGNYHSDIKVFSFIDRKVYYWSSTEFSKTAAWMVMTGYNVKNMNISTVPKEYAFSVRCVKSVSD